MQNGSHYNQYFWCGPSPDCETEDPRDAPAVSGAVMLNPPTGVLHWHWPCAADTCLQEICLIELTFLMTTFSNDWGE